MWEVFYKWGLVRDDYIPPKRDKLGKIFGFVRLQKVNNEKVMAEKLDSLWIGSYNLKVDLPKFQRGQNPVSSSGVVMQNSKHKELDNRRWIISGKSVDNWRGMPFKVNEEDMLWLEGTHVGHTLDLENAFDIQHILH